MSIPNYDSTISPSSIETSYFISELLDEEYTRIHPALDFTEDNVYVGLVFPCKAKDGKRGYRLYLVTEKNIIQCTPENLRDRKIELLRSNLLNADPSDLSRWSLEGLKSYLKDRDCVSPEKLFETVKGLFVKHVDFTDRRHYDFVTLWGIGTYFFPLFEAYPYVYVGGLHDTGKSKLLKVCSCIAFNSKLTGSMTTASLFRTLQDSRCTLLIDEIERLSDPQKSEFRTILLDGYNNGAKVIRSDTSTRAFPSQIFEAYGPKMLANIGGVDQVLGSRCICITMQSTSNTKFSSQKASVKDQEWQDARDMLYPFMMKYWRAVRQSYNEIGSETNLVNRDMEIWSPILALAKVFGNELFKEMVELATFVVAERKKENAYTPMCEIVDALCSIVDKDGYYDLDSIMRRAWIRYNKHPKWLTERFVGSRLRKAGFTSRRTSGGYEYFIVRSKVMELAEKYGIDIASEHSEGSERSARQGSQENQASS